MTGTSISIWNGDCELGAVKRLDDVPHFDIGLYRYLDSAYLSGRSPINGRCGASTSSIPRHYNR
jgi:hypothetical protein